MGVCVCVCACARVRAPPETLNPTTGVPALLPFDTHIVMYVHPRLGVKGPQLLA
jgi:hypothetical protein